MNLCCSNFKCKIKTQIALKVKFQNESTISKNAVWKCECNEFSWRVFLRFLEGYAQQTKVNDNYIMTSPIGHLSLMTFSCLYLNGCQQCCEITKLVATQFFQSMTQHRIHHTTKICDITALLSIFVEAKHENRRRLGLPMSTWYNVAKWHYILQHKMIFK